MQSAISGSCSLPIVSTTSSIVIPGAAIAAAAAARHRTPGSDTESDSETR